MVKRETMRACLSCPLCDSILCDATTISECLHTFCRKCIYEKITEDEIECCPVCSIDLGGTPLEKLRPDHNLQDLRGKIFPLKRRKVNAPEPARRKERSMSSLVVTTPKVSEKAGTTGKRTKAATIKELRDSGSWADRNVKKEESLMESTSSPDTQNKKQVKKVIIVMLYFLVMASFFIFDALCTHVSHKDGDECWDPTLDWKPLNFLVEVANRTKPLKFSASQGSGSKSKHANASHKQSQGKKPKLKDHKSKCKREDEKSNNGDRTTSETATPKRLPRTQRKRPATTYGDSRNSSQPGESSAKRRRRNGPVWFSLVASSDQEGNTSLPQVPSNFLRIRDGSIPVSFIQKYIMRKLDLKSETEVEIRCMGEAVTPKLKLQKLVDLWLQRSSKPQKFDAFIGSSAKDYMMVLVYGRKLPECNK